jgi:hypothetical protein
MTPHQERNVVAVVYCAYGDESRDRGKRIYAVACVFAHQRDWDEIAKPWTDRLAGRVFHAADCEGGHRDFKDMDEPVRHKLYRDLTSLLVKSRLVGHGDAVNVADYKKAFPDDFEHSPYLWAFRSLVQSMAELAAGAIPGGELVKITFDNNQETEYNAATVYELMLRSNQTRHRQCLADKISFACRRSVGIQIADLYVRETMKRADALLRGQTVRRASFALTDTKRFRFKPTGRSDFEFSKGTLKERGLEDKADLQKYREWLERKKINDCQTNRIVYMDQFPIELGLDPKKGKS